MTAAQVEKAFAACLPVGSHRYDYQVQVANRLLEGENLVLRAPTGSGKTLSALVPFVLGRKEGRWSRLIYALPLRTLVRSIYREAQRLAEPHGLHVTMQTGEQPDDRFFSEGDIIVCTYDQLLSGLLAAPYSLSHRQANINAACIAGALVVFDEFHLMGADQAFLTGAACLQQFHGLCQSLWMSATATLPYFDELRSALNAGCVDLPPADWEAVPSVARTRRTIQWHDTPLTADHVRKHEGKRVIVIMNRVEWAQSLYQELADNCWAKPRLLHARFFQKHRNAKERWLQRYFGRRASTPGPLICTQVIEAGMDITSDVLLTQLAPLNAVIQRSGRCARFAPEQDDEIASGEVHVYALPDEPKATLPYTPDEIARAQELLSSKAPAPTPMDPARSLEWVNHAHADLDTAALIDTWWGRRRTVDERIHGNALGGEPGGVSDLIRASDDSVRVYVANTPPEVPEALESISLTRNRLRALLNTIGESSTPQAWARKLVEDQPGWVELTPGTLRLTYAVCLSPVVARYTRCLGLQLGLEGKAGSPSKSLAGRREWSPFRLETWEEHTRAVRQRVEERACNEVPRESAAATALRERFGLEYEDYLALARFCAAMHDWGKLQTTWQQWVVAYQREKLSAPAWHPSGPLAHTDYDWRLDKGRKKLIEKRYGGLPHHAEVSAYYLTWTASEIVKDLSRDHRRSLASACCAAVLGHHGARMAGNDDREKLLSSTLTSDWKSLLPIVDSWGIQEKALSQALLASNREARLKNYLDLSVGPETQASYWALVAILTRVLRLGDQLATAEGGGE